MSAAPLPPTVELDCRAERQQTVEWCWLACVCGLARFLKVDPAPTEGDLANWATGRTDCTEVPVPAACVVPSGPPGNVFRLLAHVGIEAGGYGGPLSAETLVGEMTAGHPVLAGYLWAGGGGHFALVRGWRGWTGRFLVSDPWFGEGEVSYDEIASGYGLGRWAFAWGRFATKETQP